MMSDTRQRGSRLATGSWNTGWIIRRCSRLRRAGSGVPRHRIAPSLTGPSPATARPMVDLPEPEPPISATASP